MWYEIFRFESLSKRFGCATMLYVLNDENANGYKVYNTYTNMRTKFKIQIEGKAEWAIQNDPTKLAILDIKYPNKGKTKTTKKDSSHAKKYIHTNK